MDRIGIHLGHARPCGDARRIRNHQVCATGRKTQLIRSDAARDEQIAGRQRGGRCQHDSRFEILEPQTAATGRFAPPSLLLDREPGGARRSPPPLCWTAHTISLERKEPEFSQPVEKETASERSSESLWKGTKREVSDSPTRSAAGPTSEEREVRQGSAFDAVDPLFFTVLVTLSRGVLVGYT